jgi:hypothetical protein
LQKNNPWPSAWQLALSACGMIFLWGLALLLVGTGLVMQFGQTTAAARATPVFLVAAGLGLGGILLIPSGGFALLHLLGRSDLAQRAACSLRVTRPGLLVLAVPFILFAGQWVVDNTRLAWALLPPLHVLATGLPLLWMVALGLRGLPTGSPQRAWGVLGSGLVFGPLLILGVEISAIVILASLVALYVSLRSDLANQLTALAQRLANAPPSPQAIQRILEPYLLQPGIAYSLFIFPVVLVPLIEETLKPIGVWLLSGRGLTPAAGFTAGLISGAGYALFENLLYASNAGNWAWLVATRMGTGLMHVTTASLTGWGLALAWGEGRYLRLSLAFLTAVSIHALWNGLALLTAAAQLIPAGAANPSFLANLTVISPIGLGVLTVALFGMLLGFNRLLRRAAPPANGGLTSTANELAYPGGT